ncbi:MAG: indolepyruvate oxidoreductase subunit beta [Sphaerochaeta sp.]
MTGNIMVVGVGGQGTLLASKLLGKLFLEKGLDVKVSEVHGMSQRGGSVVTYVRYGEKVYSPVIDRGQADFIIAFELLEAARYADYLRPGGTLIANTQKINPMPVITGDAVYPENLEKKLRGLNINFIGFDALSAAKRAGSAKAVNLVLLGVLSKFFGFTEKQWTDTIMTSVPEKFVDMNVEAFRLGRERQEAQK